jgi:hypothetical protein
MNETRNLVAPIVVEEPITVSYNPETGGLEIAYTAIHPGVPNGLRMSIRIPPQAARLLSEAIQKFETKLGGPIGAPTTPRSAQ